MCVSPFANTTASGVTLYDASSAWHTDVMLAHGAGPAHTTLGTPPWSSSLFGRSHDSGWFNSFLIPFGKSIAITITCAETSTSYYMVRGMENAPLVAAGLDLPTSTRLRLLHVHETVPANGVVTLANVSGTRGLLRQVNFVSNSSTYAYQEGCVSALLDGEPLWVSSGLEDYFLGAYFHSMPETHLPYSGFHLGALPQPPAPAPATNSVAAYRIHEPDPVLFFESLSFRWIATHTNPTPLCNYDWPAAPMPAHSPTPTPAQGYVAVDALAWVYTWDA